MKTLCPCGQSIEHPDSMGGQAVKCDGCGDWVLLAKQSEGPASIPTYRPMKSRFLYIILGIFTGILGVHNLYAKRYAEAGAQFLIFILLGWMFFGILLNGGWVLYELVTVKKDGEGLPLC